jgi:hypothetical protein
VATTSSTVASPTPTPEPTGWLTGTHVFWATVIVLALAVVGTFLYKKFFSKKTVA